MIDEIKVNGYCHQCDSKTTWHVEHKLADDYLFVNDVKIKHCFVCNECGLAIEEDRWSNYRQPKPKKNTCHLIPKTGDPYTNYCSECNGCIGDVTWIVPRYCKWCGLEIDYSYEE